MNTNLYRIFGYTAGLAAALLMLSVTTMAMADDDTITLGAAVSLTGKYSTNGKHTKNGYDLGVKIINDHGGVVVNGKHYKIAIKYYDDESTPAPESSSAPSDSI